MKTTEVLTTASDAMTVRRVFGDPYQQDGVTVLTVVGAVAVAGLFFWARARRRTS